MEAICTSTLSTLLCLRTRLWICSISDTDQAVFSWCAVVTKIICTVQEQEDLRDKEHKKNGKTAGAPNVHFLTLPHPPLPHHDLAVFNKKHNTASSLLSVIANFNHILLGAVPERAGRHLKLTAETTADALVTTIENRSAQQRLLQEKKKRRNLRLHYKKCKTQISGFP